jgi:hypothetical protein
MMLAIPCMRSCILLLRVIQPANNLISSRNVGTQHDNPSVAQILHAIAVDMSLPDCLHAMHALGDHDFASQLSSLCTRGACGPEQSSPRHLLVNLPQTTGATPVLLCHCCCLVLLSCPMHGRSYCSSSCHRFSSPAFIPLPPQSDPLEPTDFVPVEVLTSDNPTEVSTQAPYREHAPFTGH